MVKRSARNKKLAALPIPDQLGTNDAAETPSGHAAKKMGVAKPSTVANARKQSQSESLEDSAFWPELRNENAISKSLRELRLEIRAAREHWPVPKALRERMIAEAAQLMLDQTQPAAIRLAAMRLISITDEANKDRPAQVDVQVSTAEDKTDIRVIVAQVARSKTVLDAIDFRPFKDLDYAD